MKRKKLKANKYEPLKINLQLHSGIFQRDDMENPLLVDDDSTEEVEIPEDYADVPPGGTTEQPTEESDEVPDNSILNQNNNTSQDTGQGNEDIKSFLESIRNEIVTELHARQQPQPQESSEPTEPTPEELQAQNDELYNRFVENPMEVFKQIKEEAKQEALKELQPIKEHYESERNRSQWNSKIDDFRLNTPDFNDYVEDVIRVIDEKPHLRDVDDVLEVAYKIAKADRLQNQVDTQPKSIEDILNNEDDLSKILSNDTVKNAIIQQYIKSLSDKNAEIPVVIGGQKGSSIVTNPEKPKNLKEASKLALKYLGG